MQAMASQVQSGQVSMSSQVRELLAKGMSTADIVKQVGCKPGLVYVIRSKESAPKPGGTTSHANAKRGPGRPAKRTASINGLDGILQAVQNSERERAEMRKALEQIQMLVSSVLSG